MSVEVLKPGLLSTPQDSGRDGHAHLGIGHAGAFDAPALRLANALAGNPANTCALEITLIGPLLKFHADAWIALTGAAIPARVEAQSIPMWSPCFVSKGSVFTLGSTQRGCRSYLAIHGGFDVEAVLGSRSLDVNAALGPFGRPLQIGDVLPVPEMLSGSFSFDRNAIRSATQENENYPTFPNPGWSIDPRPWFDADTDRPLRLLPGTHTSLLDAASRAQLHGQTFRVAPDSNRVGCRLEGPALTLSQPLELVSEACVAGTLQLTPSGQAIAMGVEHPVSGGYPRIGQIAAVDIPLLAQRRPGDALRFAPCTMEQAKCALGEREHQLRDMQAIIANRLQQGA